MILLLILLLLLGVAIGLLINGCSTDKAKNKVQGKTMQEVEKLLADMTLKEKIGQMTQITLEVVAKKDENGEVIRPLQMDEEALEKALIEYKLGSVINTGGAANKLQTWNQIITGIQETAMQETNTGIPVLYGIDAIHGANYIKNATLFPQQIAQAASFNRNIVERAAEITAYETRASGVPWTFSPVLGLGNQPLWPRFWETFGEDPYLVAEMGEQMVKGYQGQSPADTTRVAACMKHYLGYSTPRTGKDRTPALIPERVLRQDYLPPFAKAVEAGTITTMLNSAEINGTPAHADHHIISDILKKELDYKGFVVTDWQDIIYLHTRHKVAKNMREAIKLAINAGVDMSMVPHEYEQFADILYELVQDGEVSQERIDDAVTRILYVKKELDLWENPVTNYKGYQKFASEEFQKASLNAAREGAVLLANRDNYLPINKDTKLLVTGPTANSMVPLNGGWSYTWQGAETDSFANDEQTVLEALQNTFEQVDYVEGTGFHKEKNISIATRAADNADAVVLCLGESAYCETPGNIESLNLPKAQQKLAEAMAKTDKPVILLLLEGRPRIIRPFADDMEAVLMGNLLGNKGGKALADIISGKVNPSGKLPYTYPRYSNALATYRHKHTQHLQKPDGSPEFNPQYSFGHGLSYTSFSYSGLTLDKEEMAMNGELKVQVDVKNTGGRAGKEAVLLYLSDHYASITPSVKELRDFSKISLEPGEEKQVTFTLDKKDLTFVNKAYKHIAEPGMFTVMVGDQKANFKLLANE